jgi:hypothetical protein
VGGRRIDQCFSTGGTHTTCSRQVILELLSFSHLHFENVNLFIKIVLNTYINEKENICDVLTVFNWAIHIICY